MYFPKFALFLLFFLSFWTKSEAQKLIQLTDKQLVYEIGNENFMVFEDKSCQMSFEDIKQQTFSKLPTNTLNFGYSESKFWIKLELKNTTNANWVFAIMATLVDEFELYQVNSDGTCKRRISGDKYPHSQRQYDLPVFAFNLQIPQKQVSTIYLSVKSIDTKQFSLLIESEEHFLKMQHNKIYLWFFYFGLLFMMVVYNLLLYFSIYDKSYLFYVLYIFSFIFAQLTLLGFGNQHIWGNYVWYANRTPVFFTSTTGIFALLFAYNFLNVKQFYPKFKAIFVILVIFNLILGISTLFQPMAWSNRFSSYLIILQVISVVIIGILIVRKGYPPARYYMYSWAVLFLALVLFSLKMIGILPYHQITYVLLPIGAAVEVLMLSLGLGNRINTAQKEKNKAQRALVEQLQENEQVRQRIARDLHDDLGSTLSSIRILSEFAENQTKNNPADLPNLLNRIKNSTQKLQENLQDIVWTTQTKDENFEGLLIRIRQFGGEILEAKNINYQLKIDEKLNQLHLTPTIQYDIFMIFKESINNIVKYANAKNVIVNFVLKENKAVLSIKDDGVGFDIEQEREGNGLKNMPRRAENIQGELKMTSKIGKGTSIILSISVPQ